MTEQRSRGTGEKKLTKTTGDRVVKRGPKSDHEMGERLAQKVIKPQNEKKRTEETRRIGLKSATTNGPTMGSREARRKGRDCLADNC